jgi:hypothetical protein
VARKTAQGDEAAAIAAAVARFEAETGASGAKAPEAISPWRRAALLEGVGAKETILDSEGGGDKWLS